MSHDTTTTIIFVAFALLALAIVIGIISFLLDVMFPAASRMFEGASMREAFGSRWALWRKRHRRARKRSNGADSDDDDDDDETDESDDLSDATASVLSMMPVDSIVVDEDDEVVRASPATWRLGLVSDDAIVNEQILEAVHRMREGGRRERFDVTTMTPERFVEPVQPEIGRSDAPHSTRRSRVSGDLTITGPVTAGTDTVAQAVSRPNWLKIRVGKIHRSNFVLVTIQDESERIRFAQVRDSFIDNVSEQLLKPSAQLRSLADSLERGGLSEDELKREADQVKLASLHVDHLVDDLLLLIKAQEPIVPSQSNVVNVMEQLRSVASEHEALAHAHDCKIVVSGDDDLLVHGDIGQIRSALSKLVENAIEYSPEGAAVSMSAKASKDGQDAVIRVIDRGEGIPASEQGRIFERFYRGANQTDRTEDGVGLGLSIVKHVALTHHGNATVWSRRGQGSTFSLILPLANESSVQVPRTNTTEKQ